MAEEGFVVNDLDHMSTFARGVESYGIYDTKDDVWLGDKNGHEGIHPRRFRKSKGHTRRGSGKNRRTDNRSATGLRDGSAASAGVQHR